MFALPSAQALLLLAAVIVLVVVIERRWLHPFLAIVAVASVFALIAGFSVAYLGKTFGTGFAQGALAPGLVILAAAYVIAIASVPALPTWMSVPLGFAAGLAASPAAAFAVLTPLRPKRPLTLALALSASHGLVFSPVLIAAAAIIGASWTRVAMFGVPVALVVALVGVVWARRFLVVAIEPAPAGRRMHLVIAAAVLVPLVLLMIQSIGELPNEPLGGGGTRETIIGVGRPLILFLAMLGIMSIGLWRATRPVLIDPVATSSVLNSAAPLVLTVAAAAGLQRLCQETGMAELLGERLLDWRAGLLVPFLVAATIKTLQGSSLVAAIAAAGMIQPILTPLGLDHETGKALAALSIGAGAMTASHVNDDYFWLVTNSSGFGPARGLAALTLGTALQGAVAVAALFALSRLF